MKTFILIGDGVKQIVFTPETHIEKEALKLVTPSDQIHTVIKKGGFGDDDKVFGADIYMCQGGYLRSQENTESVMFVITPKEEVKS